MVGITDMVYWSLTSSKTPWMNSEESRKNLRILMISEEESVLGNKLTVKLSESSMGLD